MSVIIKGLNKPHSCGDCWYWEHCDRWRNRNWGGPPPDDCPIETAPTDVVEVRHGRWIRLDMHRGMEQFACSVCRSECYVPECMGEPLYGYCPSCGADMREKS